MPKPDPRCFGIAGRHRLSIPSSPTYDEWRERVTAAGAKIHGLAGETLTGPVSVELTFTVPRPDSHYGTGRNSSRLRPSAPAWPITRRGDIDKLARLALDALTDAHLWADDAQVVDLHPVKTFPDGPTHDALPEPGALIRIWRTPNDPVF